MAGFCLKKEVLSEISGNNKLIYALAQLEDKSIHTILGWIRTNNPNGKLTLKIYLDLIAEHLEKNPDDLIEEHQLVT